MKSHLLSLLVITTTLPGCSAAYIMGEYSGISGQEVRLSCRRTYRVHEKADKLLVVAFSVNEAAGAACRAMLTEDEPEVTEHPVRYWEAAQAYLSNKKKQHCTISGGQELELLHSEFRFACLPS